MADPWSFLSLPPELRQKVYSDLLVTDQVIVIMIYDCDTFDRPRSLAVQHDDIGNDDTGLLRLHPAILSTCRRVHDEAQSILYSANFFMLPKWPPDLNQFSEGNIDRTSCTKHTHLPQISRIRKIYSPRAQGDWLLTQGLLHLLRPGSAAIKMQWKPFPLTEVNELSVGFGRTKQSPRAYLSMILDLRLGFELVELVKLIAEWYARGGLKVTFLADDPNEDTFGTQVSEATIEVFEKTVKERREGVIRGIEDVLPEVVNECDDGISDDDGISNDDRISEDDEWNYIATNRVFERLTRQTRVH